jgi:hypothetical protein
LIIDTAADTPGSIVVTRYGPLDPGASGEPAGASSCDPDPEPELGASNVYEEWVEQPASAATQASKSFMAAEPEVRR